MEEQEILTQINKLFHEIIKRDDIVMTHETTAADVPGWDSLTHMMLIDSVEKKFNIKFKFTEVLKMKNVGDMVKAVKIRL